MSERRDDPETARLKRLRRDAEQELDDVRQHGEAAKPLLDRLHQQAAQNRLLARFLEGLEQSRRTT